VKGACAGLRVLDLTQGMAGPLAAMILADFGAEVVRVEPAEGDPGWKDPAYLLLNRGKKSIDLDVASAAGRSEFYRLVRGTDVVVESLGPDRARQCGVDYTMLAAVNPALVYCSVSAFGTSGSLVDIPLDDGLVMAKAGIYRDQPGWDQDRQRPIFRASKDASYFAAMLLVQGALAALIARDYTGQGQQVETTFVQALTCRLNPKVRWLLREGEEIPPDTSAESGPVPDDPTTLAHHRDPRDQSLTSMLVKCKDGRWIIHALTEPHFFPAWIRAIGFDWIWHDDRFKGAPREIADPAAKAELMERIRAHMKERTAAEWMEIYVASGDVCADLIETTQEALHHPQVLEAGYLIEVEDPRVGHIVQVGPLAKIPRAPASVRSAAPLPGEHSQDVLGSKTEPVLLPTPSRTSMAGPLDGVTIVECAWYYAAPFATALLSDLGARVIKIEPIAGDPYRHLASRRGTEDPVKHLGQNNMVRAMQGKESIALNLKDDRGKEILYRLIRQADVFVHNFRPGVPESLGIDEETLRAVNPDMLYHVAASYGSVGPYARQPAIDPVIAGFSGQTAYQAGDGNDPLMETGADPIAAAGHATAMMLGLFARHRTGESQHVESVMILSNLYANCEDALSYVGKPARPAVDQMQYGTGPTHRLYETAPANDDFVLYDRTENPNPHWVFLSLRDDDDFARFCRIAGRQDIADDVRFVTAIGRDQHRRELESLLESVFLTRSAPEWESSLRTAGIGCVVADAMSNFAFLFSDAVRPLDIMATTRHPSFGGTYWRHAPLLSFSVTPGHVRAFCEKGEHTRALLSEIGYGEVEQQQFEQSGVVACWEPVTSHSPTAATTR
jgi:crotonobetainyl-CoA:carnitine CoA-transferase CaiB-like acyl-CoA transferase